MGVPRDPCFLAAALLATGLIACDRPARDDGNAGGLVAEWTGSDTGRMAGPARAEWCDSLRMLEIRAIQGDSGLAIAVFPDSLPRADSYPMLPPDRADSTPPSAAAALRWFAETSIKGFQSDSGHVVLERADGRITGRFQAAMRSINDEMRLDVRGSFREVRVVPATRGCVRRPPAAPPDTV